MADPVKCEDGAAILRDAGGGQLPRASQAANTCLHAQRRMTGRSKK
jgi:hypothetical protein